MHHFTWSHDSGFTGHEVEHILLQYGIPAYRRQIVGELGLSVPDKQAVWAEHILRCAGVPLTSPLLAPQKRNTGTMPRPWGVPSRRRDWLGRLLDAMDNLLCFGANRRSAAKFVRERRRIF